MEGKKEVLLSSVSACLPSCLPHTPASWPITASESGLEQVWALDQEAWIFAWITESGPAWMLSSCALWSTVCIFLLCLPLPPLSDSPSTWSLYAVLLQFSLWWASCLTFWLLQGSAPHCTLHKMQCRVWRIGTSSLAVLHASSPHVLELPKETGYDAKITWIWILEDKCIITYIVKSFVLGCFFMLRNVERKSVTGLCFFCNTQRENTGQILRKTQGGDSSSQAPAEMSYEKFMPHFSQSLTRGIVMHLCFLFCCLLKCMEKLWTTLVLSGFYSKLPYSSWVACISRHSFNS